MTVCEKCGALVKFIAVGYNKVYACNAERLDVVTDNGHIAHGYTLHVCKKDDVSSESGKNGQPAE